MFEFDKLFARDKTDDLLICDLALYKIQTLQVRIDQLQLGDIVKEMAQLVVAQVELHKSKRAFPVFESIVTNHVGLVLIDVTFEEDQTPQVSKL